MGRFIRWYNAEYRHSSIGYVMPEQWHSGEDRALLKYREVTYCKAKERTRDAGQVRARLAVESGGHAESRSGKEAA